LEAIARAKRAEEQAAAKIREVEEKFQKGFDNSVKMMEKRVSDVIKRLEGNTGTQRPSYLELDETDTLS